MTNNRPTARIRRYRQLRGLVRWWRRVWTLDGDRRPRPIEDYPEAVYSRDVHKDPRRYRRALIGVYWGKGVNGQCRWCGGPVDFPRRYWHNGCYRAWSMAKGLTVESNRGVPLLSWRNRTCAECGTGQDGETWSFELDHKLPLSIAWETRDWKTILSAYTLDNLQWLCSDCHKSKTKTDMAILTLMRSGWPLTRLPRKPKSRKLVQPKALRELI